MLELRYLNSDDVLTYWEDLKELLHACIEVSFDFPVSETFYQKKLEGLRGYLDRGQAYVIGAIEAGNLLGFYWLYELDNGVSRKLHVAYTAVLPKGRGRGIFNMLDAKAEEKARELGITKIELIVSMENPNVIQIHEKSHGYTVAHVVMEKDLAP